jgi:hypothetical protein
VTATPYRRDSPACSACGDTVDPFECLLAWTGRLICDDCFLVQPPPAPPETLPDEVAMFEPPLRRSAQGAWVALGSRRLGLAVLGAGAALGGVGAGICCAAPRAFSGLSGGPAVLGGLVLVVAAWALRPAQRAQRV